MCSEHGHSVHSPPPRARWQSPCERRFPYVTIFSLLQSLALAKTRPVACCTRSNPSSSSHIGNMSTAATATATETTADQLSTQEKLLFAQAVYKVGAAAWSSVSSLLLAHPVCTAKSKDAFSPAGCEALYVDLMTSIGQNVYVSFYLL